MTKQLIKAKFDFLFKKLKELKVKELPYHPEVRGTLFSLEAILRLHLRGDAFNHKGIQTLNKSLVRLKELEDALGAFSYSYEIQDYMLQKTKQKPDCLAKNIKHAKKDFKKEYKHQVKSLKKTEKDLLNLTWPDAKDFVPKALNVEISRIRDKNNTKLKPLILKKKYTDHEIQEGLHEWRRMLRWVSIYFQAYKKMFYLTPEKPTSQQESELVRLYQKDPFCILGTKSAPIKLSSLAFYQLSDYIKRVGDLKSEAEIVRTLIHEFKLKVPQTFKESQSHAIYKEYEKNNVLNKLQIKEKKNAVSKKSR